MVLDEIGGAAENGTLHFPPDNHNVITNEPVTAFHKAESTLTLPYSTLAYEKDPHTIYIHQATVHGGFRCQDIFQVGSDPADKGRGDLRASEERDFVKIA